MEYVITFLEGFISFISPCMLPMLPVYLSYFAGGKNSKSATFANALAFVLGFTLVFSLLGLFAGSIGMILGRYRTAVNIISGIIVIIFGMGFMDIIPFGIFKGVRSDVKVTGIISAFVFGIIFSVSLTPCVGAFLGSALMLASSTGGVVKGLTLLLVYSLGMGLPLMISAIMINELKGMFSLIKKNYRVINLVCGIFLVIVGIAMMTGMLSKLLALFV